MDYNRYYQDELSALRTLGKSFATQNPRLAPFLSGEGVDPDVERLLEGFAFLTGRIRQKLDDDLPEFAWSLLKLIWPHFLQTIPSMTTVELKPMEILSEPQRLNKGAHIKSAPIDGTECLFQTTFNVDLYPFQINRVRHEEVNGRSHIAVNLGLFQQSTLRAIAIDKLRFHFHGAFSKTTLWYYLFRQKVLEIEVWCNTPESRTKLGVISASSIVAGGTDAADALLPSLRSQFTGHRLLFEYFCYPEKFLYIDVLGLTGLIKTFVAQPHNNADQLDDLLIESIELAFVLDYSLPINDYPTSDNIKLYCSPAVNQFEMDMRPFQKDNRRSEHRVSAEASFPEHYEVLDVKRLEGWNPLTRMVTEYPKMESFSHCQNDAGASGVNPCSMAYWSQQRQSVNGSGLNTYVTFVPLTQPRHHNPPQPQPSAKPQHLSSDSPLHDLERTLSQPETISGRLICCNKQLPVRLGIGDVYVETSSIPEYLYCQNISSVTPSYSPATRMNWVWRLTSLSALNINNIDTVDDLRALISHFDVRGLFDRQQQLATQLKTEGLIALSVTPVTRLFKGIPVRGSDFVLEVDLSKFAGMGDLFLFGEVLHQFLTLSAPINSLHQLTINASPDGEVIQWRARSVH